MSEYWKSTPKKLCEFCKCWIADNRPSIDFHEKGKNHQANVKRRLAEIKVSSAKKRKAEEEFKQNFAAIEEAALKAVQQDFKSNPTAIGQNDVKAVIAASNASVRNADSEKVETVEQQNWVKCQAPSGHTYYYNNLTGVSTWEIPKELQESKQILYAKDLEQGSKNESAEPRVSHDDSLDVSQSEVETPRDYHPLLGGWTSVPVKEGPNKSSSYAKTENEHSNPASVSAVGKDEIQGKTQDISQPRTTGVKFKEKTLKIPLSDGIEEPVAFKKRKGSAGRSIRKRDDD